MLAEFFLNNDGKLPSFIESMEDFPHLQMVKLRGNIDKSTLGDIQLYNKKVKKQGITLDKSILLDLRKVQNIDTAGIASLLKLFGELKQKKYKLGIVNAPEILRNMIGILKLEDAFLTFESQNKAFSEILAWSKDWK